MGAPTAATPGGPRPPGSSTFQQQQQQQFHNEQQQQQHQHQHSGGPTTDNNADAFVTVNNDRSNNAGGSNLERTYTSLIQEYLQVMCVDNATFLAERMVASFPNSSNARYLLGVCHYRAGDPRRALAVLETPSSSSSGDGTTSAAATSYIMAKCCYDLKECNRAEEIMLAAARKKYKEYKSEFAAAATEKSQQQQHNSDDAESPMSMEGWIVETSPCPVPNGAAGLYLLGNICRKSTRKQRAMDYFRMSLQVCNLLSFFVWILSKIFFLS